MPAKINRWVNTPEWDEAVKYWTACWNGELLDRPPVIIHVKNPDAPQVPPPPQELKARWTDPDYLIETNDAERRQYLYLGEALAGCGALQAGWCPTYGRGVVYRERNIWINPSVPDWDHAPDWERDWDDDGWRMLKKIYARVVEASSGKYFVGLPPMLPPNDLLSVMRSVGNFLLDLVDEPQRVKETLTVMRRNHLRMFNELDAMRDRSTGYGGSWWPIWCPRRLRITQSDVSCMLSSEMFEEFILPEMHALSEDVDCLFYHLDGPDAIRHLEMICSVPRIRAIQWVAGEGNWEKDWMWLFKKIQDLGRMVWVGGSPGDLERYLRELDPAKMILQTSVETVEEAQEIKRNIIRWTSSYRKNKRY